MINSIKQIQNADCYGCYSCYSSCPKKAITMKGNIEGFSYPVIAEDLCVNCGVCLKKCPANNKERCGSVKKIYRGNTVSQDIRAKGSSGGIFCLLAYKTVEMNGIVFGAVYSKDEKAIIHADNEKYSLEKLFTSKYVQSKIGDCFIEIQKILNTGRNVLFCGTPCQVAGLKSFLNKDYSNLLTVDFMCHGVPSPGLFKDDIQYTETKYKSEIIDITFRSKINGWRASTTTTTFENGDTVYTPNKESFFYRAFLKNYSLRKSCYSCHFYNNHFADITLADDWRVPKSLDDDTGISIIITNTERGESWITNIANELSLYSIEPEQFDFNTYRHCYSVSERSAFFLDYQKNGYIALKEKWEKIVLKENKEKTSFIKKVKKYLSRIIK